MKLDPPPQPSSRTMFSWSKVPPVVSPVEGAANSPVSYFVRAFLLFQDPSCSLSSNFGENFASLMLVSARRVFSSSQDTRLGARSGWRAEGVGGWGGGVGFVIRMGEGTQKDGDLSNGSPILFDITWTQKNRWGEELDFGEMGLANGTSDMGSGLPLGFFKCPPNEGARKNWRKPTYPGRIWPVQNLSLGFPFKAAATRRFLADPSPWGMILIWGCMSNNPCSQTIRLNFAAFRPSHRWDEGFCSFMMSMCPSLARPRRLPDSKRGKHPKVSQVCQSTKHGAPCS